MEIPLTKKLYDRVGKLVNYMAEDNNDGTFKLTFEYDGYYDNNKLFHQEAVYIVIPHASFNPKIYLVKDNKLYCGSNLLDCIYPQVNEDKVLFQLIFPDDEE